MKLSRPAQVLTATASGATVVAALLIGVSTAGIGQAEAVTAVATPSRIVNSTAAGAHRVATTATTRRLGAIIHTGMDASAITEWVIYGIPVTTQAGHSFGFQLSIGENNGKLDPVLEIQEVRPGKAMKPGFHATEGSYVLDGGIQQPAFGYYVGHPAKITGQVGGKTVVAQKVKWSHNKKVTVFWFDNTIVTGNDVLTSVSAYDQAGHRVATAKVYGTGE